MCIATLLDSPAWAGDIYFATALEVFKAAVQKQNRHYIFIHTNTWHAAGILQLGGTASTNP